MNYYDNALEVHDAAEILFKNSKYRISIYNSCLAVELYMKSKLSLVNGGERFEFSHDVVNIYRLLCKRYEPKNDLLHAVSLSRKYFNESRYPHGDVEIYTEEFAQEFLGYVDDVKNYIDNDCEATIDDLKNKFQK